MLNSMENPSLPRYKTRVKNYFLTVLIRYLSACLFFDSLPVCLSLFLYFFLSVFLLLLFSFCVCVCLCDGSGGYSYDGIGGCGYDCVSGCS